MLVHLFTEIRGRRAPRNPRAVPALALALFCCACASAPTGTSVASRSAGAAAASSAPEPGVVLAPGVSAAATDGSRQPAASSAAQDPGSRFPIHGSITTTLRERWTADEHDLDLASTVSLDLGDPQKNRWTGHVMTQIPVDLDGKRNSDSVFFDLDDTYDAAVVPRLYDAYAETRDAGFLASARIGRQTLWDTPVFAWLDGVSAETKETGQARVSLGAYGGIPVHLYESSREGSFLGGLYGQAQPWTRGRLRLDWMNIQDEADSGSHEQDLWKAGVWQGIGQSTRVEATVSRLGSEERDWSAAATWWDRETDLSVQASYYELRATQGDLPLEIDPFYATLYDLFPYHQARLMASKGFGGKLAVQAGAEARRVSDESDEGQWNRDFERYFSTVQVIDVLPAHLVLGLTGEVWNSQGNDIDTWGVDLSRRFGEVLDASAGSYYSLYKTSVASSTESDDVRTWFLRLRWKRSKGSVFDLRYDVEDMDPETVQSLRLGWTWRF